MATLVQSDQCWFVCTMLVHILLAKNLGFSKGVLTSCAHAWIFFELCILTAYYIQTTKMYLSNKIVKNKA